MTLLHWRIGAVARARAGYQLSVSSYRRLRLSLSHLCYVPILHAVCRSPATAIRLNKCISDEFQSREREPSHVQAFINLEWPWWEDGRPHCLQWGRRREGWCVAFLFLFVNSHQQERERGKVITLCVRHCHIAATTKYTNYFCPLHENFFSKWTTKQRSGEKKWGRFFYDINIRLRHAVKGSPFGVGSKIPKKISPFCSNFSVIK